MVARWPDLDTWLGEESEQPTLHAVGDVTLSGRVELTLRTRTDGGRPALVVGCDGKNLWVTGPQGDQLGETVLTEPAATLRILTIGEYVEVYANGIFALTTCATRAAPPPGRPCRKDPPASSPPARSGCPTPAATTPRPCGLAPPPTDRQQSAERTPERRHRHEHHRRRPPLTRRAAGRLHRPPSDRVRQRQQRLVAEGTHGGGTIAEPGGDTAGSCHRRPEGGNLLAEAWTTAPSNAARTPRTAENHVARALAKSGLTSRAQLAAWAYQQHTAAAGYGGRHKTGQQSRGL